jgi:hypothetical protein
VLTINTGHAQDGFAARILTIHVTIHCWLLMIFIVPPRIEIAYKLLILKDFIYKRGNQRTYAEVGFI